MRSLKNTLIFAFVIITTVQINGQAKVLVDSTLLTEREVAVGLEVPWEILWGPDDHIWVTEKRGRILRINPDSGNIMVAGDIQSSVYWDSEPGLLGMVLHPDFENTALVYMVYTYLPGGFQLKERLVSYEWDGSQLMNETILLDDLPAEGIHNGSRLVITPDNKILMTTGDVANANTSQNMSTLNGKLLRLNLDGSVPDDNPFPGSLIYTLGHRNSQGLAYGPQGNLYSSEHGAQLSDEFNMIEAGRNYGWPTVQGACDSAFEMDFCNMFNVKEPLAEWSPCIAVNGIAYYDHPAIPEWQGKMLMAVLGGLGGNFHRMLILGFNNDGTEVVSENIFFTNYGRLRDVCVNPHTGAIYFATNGFSYPSSGPNRIIEYRNEAYDPTSSLPELEGDQFFNVFPNPILDNRQIQFNCSESFIGSTINIFSYDGALVQQNQISLSIGEIDLQNLSVGNYYFRIESKEGTVTKSLIIQ